MKIDPEILDPITIAAHMRDISRQLAIDVIRVESSHDPTPIHVHLADLHILIQMLRKIHDVDTSAFCELIADRFPVIETGSLTRKEKQRRKAVHVAG